MSMTRTRELLKLRLHIRPYILPEYFRPVNKIYFQRIKITILLHVWWHHHYIAKRYLFASRVPDFIKDSKFIFLNSMQIFRWQMDGLFLLHAICRHLQWRSSHVENKRSYGRARYVPSRRIIGT